MILIENEFLSADHIQRIYVKRVNDENCSVIVQMTGCNAEYGFGTDYVLDRKMALELRRRIVNAIADYKSSDMPSVQSVNIPTYKEVHPENDSENS